MSASPVESSFSFPPPEKEGVDLLVMAGEHSGDEHAAKMVTSLLKRNPNLNIVAIGGEELRQAGAELLFDLVQHSVVGFFEAVKKYTTFKPIFDESVNWIRKHQPKAVCFVDNPGFNLRVAQALHDASISKKSGGSVSLLYYISPQVWAWKAKRRFKMAKLLDSLAVIFPFEVESFADTDLETIFVGHPFLGNEYDLPVHYDPDGPVLLLPGSRSAAVGRIAPVTSVESTGRNFMQSAYMQAMF